MTDNCHDAQKRGAALQKNNNDEIQYCSYVTVEGKLSSAPIGYTVGWDFDGCQSYFASLRFVSLHKQSVFVMVYEINHQ